MSVQNGPDGANAAMRVLVIRLGALGDIVQSFGPFAAIRARHAQACITLLTTAPFAGWLRAAPWFDTVMEDARPAWWDVRGLARLSARLRGFDLVYDLQTSGRSRQYWWLAGRPRWSGIGRWVSHPHRDAGRNALHTRTRQAGQLHDAGIDTVPVVRPCEWRALVANRPALPAAPPRAVLVPGASTHRPDKCWPAVHYAQLAMRLRALGYAVVVVGGEADRAAGAAISSESDGCEDLTGRTTLAQLAGQLGAAALVIGNDTGPMHLAAALERRCIVLFGGASNPALTAPMLPDGQAVTVLREGRLDMLSVDRVAAALG